MKNLILLFSLCFYCTYATAQDTLYVKDCGLLPNTFTNSTPALNRILEKCKHQKAKVLVFESGRYDFWPEGATRKELFVTNTTSEDESADKTKIMGVYMNQMEDLTVEGNDCTWMFHGKMTTVAIDHSKAITLRNLHIDFERPGGSELKYISSTANTLTVQAHKDTRYSIIDGKLNLIGEGWRSNRNHCIAYNEDNEHMQYSYDWGNLEKYPVKEIAPQMLQFQIPEDFEPVMGTTLTIRDIIRDQVGILLYYSQDIKLNQVYVHYMHGLGIVSQYCKNVTMNKVKCAPREGSGRILASSADFMHFSGCSGKVTVKDCYFSGAQDDCVNVHGTNLRAVEKKGTHSLKVRFMHPQSYGYEAYWEGDTVALVHAATMQRFSTAQVTKVERVNNYEILLTLDKEIPAEMKIGHDVVENMTCTPEVEITGNYFSHTSTRGVLCTTPRKAVITRNTFYKTAMSGILIEADAEGWFESGPVCDVTITQNEFIDCAWNGNPHKTVIAINPSNKVIDPKKPVHQNITITQNEFKLSGNPALYAKSVKGLVFMQNTFINEGNTLTITEGCSKVKLK